MWLLKVDKKLSAFTRRDDFKSLLENLNELALASAQIRESLQYCPLVSILVCGLSQWFGNVAPGVKKPGLSS